MARELGSDTSLTLLERVQKFPADGEPPGMSSSAVTIPYLRLVRQVGPAIVGRGRRRPGRPGQALTAMRNFRYDPSRSFWRRLKTVTQHALSDFLAGRGKEPGQLHPEIAIADRVDVRDNLERELEGLFDRDLFQMAMRRVEKRVKPVTWDSFRLMALEVSPATKPGSGLTCPWPTSSWPRIASRSSSRKRYGS